MHPVRPVCAFTATGKKRGRKSEENENQASARSEKCEYPSVARGRPMRRDALKVHPLASSARAVKNAICTSAAGRCVVFARDYVFHVRAHVCVFTCYTITEDRKVGRSEWCH